jgi:hypothetical protein
MGTSSSSFWRGNNPFVGSGFGERAPSFATIEAISSLSLVEAPKPRSQAALLANRLDFSCSLSFIVSMRDRDSSAIKLLPSISIIIDTWDCQFNNTSGHETANIINYWHYLLVMSILFVALVEWVC